MKRLRIVMGVLGVVLGLPQSGAAQVMLGIDGPTGDVTNPVSFCGFAVDPAAHPRAGIYGVSVWFYTPTGIQIVQATVGLSRPDIAATYQVVQDANLGWCVPPTVIPNGVTVMVVKATSLLHIGPDGNPIVYQREWSFTVNGTLFSWMNNPKQGQVLPTTFALAGVAKDLATGQLPRWVRLLTVDRAHPDFLPLIRGYATIGTSRPGTPWDGYGWDASLSIVPGVYDLIAETTMWSGEIESRVVRITVQ